MITLRCFQQFLHRYTLPYREETVDANWLFSAYAIHPPVQGGNIWWNWKGVITDDTPSRTGRKHSVLMRVSAPPNTSLCKLHKCFYFSSFRGRKPHGLPWGGSLLQVTGFHPPQLYIIQMLHLYQKSHPFLPLFLLSLLSLPAVRHLLFLQNL